MNDEVNTEELAETQDCEVDESLEQPVEDIIEPEECTGETAEPVGEELPEETAEEPAEESVDCYLEQFNALKDSTLQLKQLFEKRLLIDEQKNRIIENQSRELEKYRDGMYEKMFKPILADVVGIADDLHRMVRAYRGKTEESIPTEKLISILECYESDVEEILEKYGVDIYICESESFEPIRQKSVKLIETADPELNRKIAERLSKGYSLGEKVLQPEKVYAYKYVQPKADTVSENANESMKEE